MENESELIQRKLQKSLQIIRKYDWLIDAYVLDFYVDNHWEKLPPSWQKYLDALQPDFLSELLMENSKAVKFNNKVWPLELLALRCILHDLCISRKQENKQLKPVSVVLEHPKLKHVFTKCVKPKKRHEIEEMAAACQRSCSETPVNFVVDFGAGCGHLARVLGYGLGIRVCCLEMQEQLNKQARIIDNQLEMTAAKHMTPADCIAFQRPTHVSLRLTADMQPHEFLAIIQAALHLPNTDFRFGIIGLHPCGDLGAILMRMFLNCAQAKFLNFVGCCYMKLSTAGAQTIHNNYGYPLSTYMRSLKHSHLSYEAREISCHASEMYCDRLIAGDYEHLKVHSFRAASERILIRHWPELKRCGLRSVKHVPGMHFEEYFYKAVDGLSAANLCPSELHSPQTACDLLHWKRIVIFYTLRLMFAPLVESVILYDRWLYLQENLCQVQIKAIFDPRSSPRNHITCAVKRS